MGQKYKQSWKLMLKNCGHSMKWKELAVNRMLLVMIKRRANTFFMIVQRKVLVHQVRDRFSGAAAYFGWMREAKRENTRCGLRPMSDKAASQKTRSPEGCDENGPAAALLLSHVSIQICSFVAPCRRPILIATPLNQSRTWCTSVLHQNAAATKIKRASGSSSPRELVHRVISRRHTAVGQLADFQGANDEHISIDT